MAANLLIIARVLVICRDAQRGSMLFQERIPSSESKCVCAPAKREVGTSERMKYFWSYEVITVKKVTGIHRLGSLLYNQKESLCINRQV
jgi:hypothetical protein